MSSTIGGEGAIAEALVILRHMWIHRKMQIKIKNRTLVDIDHTIPGLIDDTINALWGSKQRELRPMIIKKHQKDDGQGWDLVIHIPPGISYRDFAGKLNYFADATGGAVEIKKRGKAAIMTVLVNELKRSYPYKWHDHSHPHNIYQYLHQHQHQHRNKKKHLPFPIGHSAAGHIVGDLVEYPNLLIAGHPGAGKSNMLHVILTSLLIIPHVTQNTQHQIWPIIIDLKRTEYGYLENHALLIEHLPDAKKILKAINKEIDRRAGVLKKQSTVKNQDLSSPMPWIVLVIDELAELHDKECQELLNRIVRLGRAPGVCTVAATQRPSSTMFQAWGDSKAMFAATICFKVRDEVNSRMVLGNDLASIMPEIPGRAIYQWERELEVQTPNLPVSKARKILEDVFPVPVPDQEARAMEQYSNGESRGVIDVCKLAPKRLPPRQGHSGGSDAPGGLKHISNSPPVL